jgi:hypothetical protein
VLSLFPAPSERHELKISLGDASGGGLSVIVEFPKI